MGFRAWRRRGLRLRLLALTRAVLEQERGRWFATRQRSGLDRGPRASPAA